MFNDLYFRFCHHFEFHLAVRYIAGFTDILAFFERLKEIGLWHGYYPEASTSILIVCQHNLEAAKEYFALQQFRLTTGEQYFRGYIGA
jgi:hypothetical protein